MSIQKGKYFDVKKTKAYFDAMNTEMDKYIANADITNAEYDAFNASESFKGLTANSVKLLVKNRAGLFLNETVKAQKMVKDAQKYTLTTFANIVDSAPNARIEYDTLRTIETDFKGFYNKFHHISHRVDKLSDDLNREFGYYANFGKPNASAVKNEFNSFCGGESDGVGYLSECINKLVRFDEITHEYITRKEINTHSTTISTKAKSVGAALMSPVAKSTKMKKYTIRTISTAPVSEDTESDDMFKSFQKEFGFTEEETKALQDAYEAFENSDVSKGLSNREKINLFFSNMAALYSGYSSDSTLFAKMGNNPSPEEAKNFFDDCGVDGTEISNIVNNQHSQCGQTGTRDFAHECATLSVMANDSAAKWVANKVDSVDALVGYKGDIYSKSMGIDDIQSDIAAVNVYQRMLDCDDGNIWNTYVEYNNGVADGSINESREFLSNYGNGDPEKGMKNLKIELDDASFGTWYLSGEIYGGEGGYYGTAPYSYSQYGSGYNYNPGGYSDYGYYDGQPKTVEECRENFLDYISEESGIEWK